MTDQKTEQSEEIINLRDKGVKNSNGKLVKGCVKNATTKLCIGSIPSTYESIIYRSDSKKAFGTSQKRWSEKYQLESYKNKNTTSTSFTTKESEPIKINVSHSKQGYGPLASKNKRQWMRLVKTPGPGKYELGPRKKKSIQLRKCLSRQSKKNIPLKNYCQDLNEPGPGAYDHEVGQNFHSGFKSSFETKVKRDSYIPKNKNPGPGTYIKEQQKQQKTSMSPIKEEKNEKGKSTLLDLIKQQSFQEPGPGWYNYDIPNFKPVYERIKMSKNFIVPATNAKKQNENSPSPTLYQIKRMYDDEQLKLIKWACFMSETKRDPFKGKEFQGPNLRPLVESKKNFHFNIKNYWL